MSAGRLAGKVAIITGASGGLGPVMGELFVREGARVLLAARREDMVLEQAARIGAGAVGLRADVTVEGEVEAMVTRALDEFGAIDIMVNNAATPGKDKYIWEQTLENWNATIAVDVTAAMLCSREVLKRSMIERGSGVILNFSSNVGFTAMQRKSHYVTAKSALRAFTQVMANEVGPHGIRCNCIVPGFIDTELLRGWMKRLAVERGVDYEDVRAGLLAGTSLRDVSTTADVANLALFLASDESRTITGQSILVDAGEYKLG